jgi:MFS transporter, DHA1 family, multidrug resistance protein
VTLFYSPLHGSFVRFSVAAGLVYTAYAMCRAPVLPLFARQLGAGPELVGLVAGASTVTGIFLKLPAGAISDAIGRRAVLLGAATVAALMPFVYPWVAAIGLLVLLRLIHGSATALFGPTASATVADMAPASERGRWGGTYSSIQGAGQALGPVLAGWLLGRSGFGLTFMTAGAIGVGAWIVLAWQRELGTRSHHISWVDARRAIREVALDRRMLVTSLAQAGQFLLHGLITAFLPVYAVERIGLTPGEAGFLFGAQMVTTILARPAFGRLSDRAGRRPMIVIGLSTCAVSVALFARADGFVPLLALSALYGAGLAITTSSTMALITDLADRARYGAAHGLFGTIFDIGDALGPIAGGLVAGRFGYHTLFHSAAALALAIAAIFALMSARWRVPN